MFDEDDAIGFVLWTAETGNASRTDWDALRDHADGDGRDKWLRMARAAILRMRVLRIVD